MDKFDKILHIVISLGTVWLLQTIGVSIADSLIFVGLMNVYWVLEEIQKSLSPKEKKEVGIT